MKIFNLNFFSLVIVSLALGLGIGLPSFIVQSIWNSSVISASFERDLTIQLWQAALLWGAILASLAHFGVFKIKMDLKSIESIDISKIDDPILKDEIEKLKAEFKQKEDKRSEPPANDQK